MAKPTLSPPVFSLFVLFSILYLGGCLDMANGHRTWCIANPLYRDSALAANIEYACSQMDCRLIEPDGPCFEPDTLLHHASFVMNLYYQANGRDLSSCNFTNSGLVSLTDPSYGNCTFESGGAVADQEPSGSWCVAKPGTSDELLELNINFACNRVDCSPTHVGGACFYPTNLINHASYAMNLYYQTSSRKNTSCDFRDTALLVSSDPSYGNCSYQYSHN